MIKQQGQILKTSARIKSGRGLFLILVMMLLSQVTWSQCKTITNLKEEKLTDMSLYFYPSTLRMVNLEQNEEFNRLIQDIDKLIFYKMNWKFEMVDLYNILGELQRKDQFEEYILVDGPKYKFFLLGRESPTETIGMAYFENSHYIFDIAGSLEIKEIPKLYEYIAQNDSTFKSKFANAWNMMEIGMEISNDPH